MKIKKALKYSLAVALVFSTATTLAGCNKDDETKTELTEQEKIYNLAVSAGFEGSYDEWIATIRGVDGEDGKDGKDGATWISESRAPTAGDGQNGDFFYDSAAQKIYQKKSNAWVLISTIEDGGVGATGNGIASIAKTETNGKVDTYTVTFTDNTINPFTFTVTNGNDGNNGTDGKSIESATINASGELVITFDDQAHTSINLGNVKGADGKGIVAVSSQDSQDGLQTTYTITYTTGDPYTFTVRHGRDGTNGAKWYSAEVVDNSVGNNGDFFYDTDDNAIYKKVGGSWGSPIAQIKDGVDGKDGATWLSDAAAPNPETGKVGDFFFDTAGKDIYIKVYVDDSETETEWRKVTSLDEEYTLEDGDYTGVMLNSAFTLTLEDGEIKSLVVEGFEGFDFKPTYAIKDGVISVTVQVPTEENPLVTEPVTSKLVLKEGNELVAYLEEDDATLLYGTYNVLGQGNSQGSFVAISANKAIGNYNGMPISGSIEYTYLDVDDGYANAVIDMAGATMTVNFNLYYRNMYINGIDYKYEQKYKNGENTIEVKSEQDNFVVTYNGQVITHEVDSYSQDERYVYLVITVDDETYSVELDPITQEYNKVILASEIYADAEEGSAYVMSNYYNKPAGSTLTVSEEDFEKVYTPVYYVDERANDTTIYINGNEYTQDEVSISVGNNNHIQLPVWKVKNGKLYISSILFKANALGRNGEINVSGYGNSVELNLDEYKNELEYPNVYGIPETGIHLESGTDYLHSDYNDTYEYSSCDGRTTIRIPLGSDETLKDVVAFTMKDYGSVVTYGYTTVDNIDGQYYLVLYPSYADGYYTEDRAYEFNYSFVLSNGMNGNYRFDIKLNAIDVEVYNSIEANIASIESTLYNKPAETNVTELATDNIWYTRVGNVYDFKIGIPSVIYFDGMGFYSEQTSKVSVGNNNFVNKPVWKVDNETGDLYVSSTMLKMLALGSGGEVELSTGYGEDEVFTILNLPQYSYKDNQQFIMNPDVYKGTHVGENENQLTTESVEVEQGQFEQFYMYNSTDGRNTIRVYLGTDPALATAKVFTAKMYIGENGSSIATGYTTVDKIGDAYYLVLYPKYYDGSYTAEHESNYMLIYQYVVDSGIVGVANIMVNLSAPVADPGE